MPQPSETPSPATGRYRQFAPLAWQRRSSSLSRYALLAYALIVIDASLYPFTGWRDLGIAPYAYLAADWPPRALPFDLLVNALGYLPLGFVCGLALHPRLRGAAMVIVAVLFCGLLSVHLEALQTYLPSRVASKVDVVSNVAGGLIGALLAARFAKALIDTGRLRIARTRWFAGDASRGLVLIVLWFGALIYPDAFVFGMGGLLKAFDPAQSDVFATLAGIVQGGDAVETAKHYRLAEATVTALSMCAAGLLFLLLLRRSVAWPLRVAAVMAFVLATVVVEASAQAFLFDGAIAWPPLTPGARSGIAVAVVALAVATLLPASVRWALGLAAVVAALVLVNIYPDNPYGNAVGAAWTGGKLMNFYGLASGLNLVWPYLAIAYFVRHRRRRTIPDGPEARRAASGSSL